MSSVIGCVSQILAAGDGVWDSPSQSAGKMVDQGGGYSVDEPEGIDLLAENGLSLISGSLSSTSVDVTTGVAFGYVNPSLHFVFAGSDESTNNADGNACESILGNCSLTITPDH